MIETDAMTDAQLESELIKPDYSFKGVPLWPWSRAARHCWRMLCNNDNDLVIFQTLAMMWVLKNRGGKTAADDFKQQVIPALYQDINQARAEIILWRNELTDEDEQEALQIQEAILKAEELSAIHVSPVAGQKKMEATSPATSATTSTSSENATDGAAT